ncbi:MAG: N-acetylmuramoyl-L-alanine amidase [Paramuribaculum sp.]|nr:N-acetylmuramoyl-L-alanine amidase [Paramuribaculum sp.]
MRKIQEIIVHCTATKAGRNVTAGEIDVWHKSRGWNGIGYHYVVMLDGVVVSGRGENEVGAHCKGKNATSIGVVYVGGLDGNGMPCDTRTDAQKSSLRRLLLELLERYPSASIYGHRDFAAKACPCFDAKKEYEKLKMCG